MYLYRNTITFTLNTNSSILYDLSHCLFPEFSVSNSSDQDHLGSHYWVRTSTIADSDSDETILSKTKTLSYLFRGACFLKGYRYSPQEFSVSTLYRDQQRILFDSSDIPLTDDLPLPEYDSAVTLFMDLKNPLNRYLYLALRDPMIFKCLIFCSDRFDYVDLYKLYDLLKENEPALLSAYTKQLNQFTCTANNFSASGFEARHGKKGADLQDIQNNLITLETSRKLFREIMTNVIEKRFQALMTAV